MHLLETIGNTPLIELRNTTASTEGRLLFKYERGNPGGSIKDRPALFIVTEAEKRGLLKPGGTIIESSSGNYGISLAMIGAAKGYRVIILVDPKTTATNLALLKCFGAEVIVVTEQDDSGSYHKTRISLANKLASEIPDAFRPDQCFNLLNSTAHYQGTAREIFADCPDNVAAIVAAVSTGGQLGGISRYTKTYRPDVKVIGVDAVGSSIFGGESHSYLIPGIGLAWTPCNVAVENIDRIDRIEFVLERIGTISLCYAGIETAAEQRGEAGFLELLAVGPLPGIIEISGEALFLAALFIDGAPFRIVGVFRLVVGSIHIVDAAGQAGIHNRKILIRQGDVHHQIGLIAFDQSDDFFCFIGIHLRGGDLRFGFGRQLGRELIALGFGTAGDAQFGKHIAQLAAFVNGNGSNAAAADNKNFAHEKSLLLKIQTAESCYYL